MIKENMGKGRKVRSEKMMACPPCCRRHLSWFTGRAASGTTAVKLKRQRDSWFSVILFTLVPGFRLRRGTNEQRTLQQNLLKLPIHCLSCILNTFIRFPSRHFLFNCLALYLLNLLINSFA